MSVAHVSYGTYPLSPSPHIQPRPRLLADQLDIYRNAIGSSHNVRLARSPVVGWSVISTLDMLYLSQDLNLYRRGRRAFLAGEVDTPISSGVSSALTK